MKIWINSHEYVDIGKRPIESLLAEIATRKNTQAYWSLNAILPDPDPVLKKQGKDISIYRQLLADAHVWAAVQSRKAGVLSMQWSVERNSATESISVFIEEIFDRLDIYRIISEILDTPLYGFQPMEILWAVKDNRLVPQDIQAKPQEWFHFDVNNQIRLKTNLRVNIPLLKDQAGYLLPDFKFLLLTYNASYNNPYGERILSRVFWPVTFKKGGIKFWVIFAEKFGMPYIVGKHPRGIGKQEVDDMANMLELMIQDAVAVIPEDSDVDIIESGSKQASSSVYKELIDLCNAEISKAILGQTLTTEIGGRGSFAAAKTHLDVRQDIVESDKRLVEKALNQLIGWIVELNFGQVEKPIFTLWQEEDVDKNLAERDQILAAAGVRFTKTYFRKAYGFNEDDIEIPEPIAQQFMEFAHTLPTNRPLPKPQKQLFSILDKLTPNMLQKQMETILKPIFNLIENESDYFEIMQKLVETFPKMQTDDLENLLERLMFVSEIWGRLNAQKR